MVPRVSQAIMATPRLQSLDIPAPVVYSGKFLVAWPLSYHFLNGIRHLVREALHVASSYHTWLAGLGREARV